MSIYQQRQSCWRYQQRHGRAWSWQHRGSCRKTRDGGKGLLFKIFAGLDAFDIEINETDPDKIVEIVKALEPTFGGINLEDIKAPECFKIETRLKEECDIPVMHDDQHGTAIIYGAGLLNALRFRERRLGRSSLLSMVPERQL